MRDASCSRGPSAVGMRWARIIGGVLIAAIAWVVVASPVAAAHPATVLRAPASSGAVWSWPVPSPPIVAAFAAPSTAYSAGHRGIDLGVVAGSAVSAPDDAVVRFSGVVVDRPVVTLDHGGGVLSSYEPVEGLLPVGAPVARGAVVGTVAAGGHCDGACLHVGVRVDGQYVSPLLYFGGVPPAVLLPLGGG